MQTRQEGRLGVPSVCSKREFLAFFLFQKIFHPAPTFFSVMRALADMSRRGPERSAATGAARFRAAWT
jgi:hypothetical protein